MAVKHKFTCIESDMDFLTVDSDINKQVLIFTGEYELDTDYGLETIKTHYYLDLQTSIKLAKTIRTEINKVKGI